MFIDHRIRDWNVGWDSLSIPLQQPKSPCWMHQKLKNKFHAYHQVYASMIYNVWSTFQTWHEVFSIRCILVINYLFWKFFFFNRGIIFILHYDLYFELLIWLLIVDTQLKYGNKFEQLLYLAGHLEMCENSLVFKLNKSLESREQ